MENNMLKRLIRVVFHTIVSPITILLYFVFMFGVVIDMLIMPIEYIITGKTFFDYYVCDRPFAKPFDWFTDLIDNVSYYIYCKITKVEYKHNYWLNN